MRHTIVSMKRIGAALALVYVSVLVASVHAQNQPLEGRKAEEAYKNIQVLKGTPASELILAMHFIRTALGVDCEFCHETPDRASDSKKTKETARQMMSMMLSVNKTMFQGRQVVTCYTCHRGSTRPMGVPPLPVFETPEATTVALPSVDQILANYVRALGGEQAIRKVTTRVITATQYIPTGPGGTIPVPAQAELHQKAPNLVLNVYRTPTYTISDGFDGTTKWAQDANGRVINAFEIDSLRARRNANFYESLDLKQEYSRLTVTGVERVGDREAFVLMGYPQNDAPERLYFDRDTGLLLRKASVLPSPVGANPYQVDYDDYRDVGNGVKVPYVIEVSPATPRTEFGVTVTIRVQKVEENVPIENSKFAKPQPRPAQPR